MPRLTSFQEARAASRDLSQYNLTAVVIARNFPDDLLFKLEAVLSFIEHMDVIVTSSVLIDTPSPFDQFPMHIRTPRRHNSGAAIVGSDIFFPNSRPTFIEKAIKCLRDSAYCNGTGFRTLFFKTVETFRSRKSFIEVSYFLLFSGLEAYARKSQNDFHTREVAVVLTKQLSSLQFDVCTFKADQLERSMDTYARLRNALFHYGDLETRRNIQGRIQTYRLTDYYSHFQVLVALVVLRATDFDDGHINWDAWVDRQLFI